MVGPSKTSGPLRSAALSLVALLACAHAADPLSGTQWKLVGWTLSSIDPATVTITAKFADGRISGNGGVNRYSGPYTIGSNNTFSAGPLVATRMAGPEPAMRAEGAYVTLLAQAKSCKLTDGKLTLYDKGGNESLIFAAASN